MRYLFIAFLLTLILPFNEQAIGQDMSFYYQTGKLTPLSHGESAEFTLVVYKNRGVMFELDSNYGISSAIVFSPAQALPRVSHSGSLDVIPGISAYGIALGMPRDQVKATPYVKAENIRLEDAGNLIVVETGGTQLLINFSDDKVTQVRVQGGFRTREGITNESNEAQISSVYGMPDQRFAYSRANIFRPIIFMFIIMPIFGVLTGKIILCSRTVISDTVGRTLSMSGLGALGLGIASLLSASIFLISTGMDGDWVSQ